MKDITLIMPAYNGESTIYKTLIDILCLDDIKRVDKLIIIDDCSIDETVNKIRYFIDIFQKLNIELYQHDENIDITKTLNEGLLIAKTKYVLFCQQDILIEKNAITKIMEQFDKNVIAVFPIISYSFEYWKNYNFWMKCYFSRQLNRSIPSFALKFDCFLRQELIDIGMFDEQKFASGPDGDIRLRIYQSKFICKNANTEIIHIHNNNDNFSFMDILKKEAVYGKCKGSFIRKYYDTLKIKQIIGSQFREIITIGLLIPFVNILSIILILFFSFAYTWKVFIYEWKNPKILVLPFVNIISFFVHAYNGFKGFLLK